MLNAIYSKTKETLRTADKLVLTIVIFIILGAFMVVPAMASSGSGSTTSSGSGGKTITSTAGLDMNIGSFSGLITDAFSEMMGDVSGDANKRAAFVKDFDTVGTSNSGVDNNHIGLYNIGNIFGVQSAKASKSHASNVYSIADDQTAMRITLDTISGWYDADTTALKESAMSQYILFGSALNAMGIDEFRSATGNADMIRMITGYVLYVCFILAYSASGLMIKVTQLMQHLNIFGMLHNSMVDGSTNSLISNVTNGSGAVNTSAGAYMGLGGSLMRSLRSIYAHLMPFRWIVLGLLVVLFVGSITVYKSKAVGVAATTQERTRRLIMRVIIMCIGVPLVGMVYTTGLNAVYTGLTEAQYNVTDYVYSQFLDYEQWVVNDPGKAFIGVAMGRSTSSEFGNLVVEFDTYKKSIDVYKTVGTGSNISTDSINVPKVVYNINANLYGGNILPNSYENSAHAMPLYQTTNQINNGQYVNIAYDGLINNAQTAKIADQYKKEAYGSARNLILKYARNNTVVADNLNKYYIEALGNMGLTLGISSIDRNNTLTINEDEQTAYSAILTRMFSPDSSSNIWAFSEKMEGSSKTFDKWGDKFEITLHGMPVFTTHPAAYNGNNTMYNGISIEKTQALNTTVKNAMWQVLWPVHYMPGFTNGISAVRELDSQNDLLLHVIPGGTDVQYVQSQGSAVYNQCIYRYEYQGCGMSPLALYNFLHSKFELGVLDVYTPALTSNSGVSTMHYAVTTPYSGIPEVVQILFTICLLFSIGIIGWVFGVSLLLNTLVQTLKAIPLVFKMAVGSLQGFVEAILTVLSILAEMLITMALYAFSIQIIDFLIAVVDTIATGIMDAFMSTDGETLSLINNLLTMGVILWGTFELIRWRRAVTMSVKSMITHIVNTVFGTSAAMPSSASSGMLKAAAVGMTAAAVGGALAEQGALDDVVNDMTQSDIGSNVGDKLKEGDFSGALEDVKDYATGNYDGDVRGGSAMDREAQAKGLLPKYDENGNRAHDEETGEALYEDPGTGETYSESEMQDLPDNNQGLTDEQQAAVDEMDDKISGLREAGKNEEADKMAMDRAAMVAGFKKDNYDKARAAGVSDWASHERSMADTNTGASAYAPESVEGADIPEEPSGHSLSGDEKATYDAARSGNAKTLQKMGSKYNAHGLTQKQQEAINEMIANGASEQEVSAAVDNFAQENFGDDYGAVVDKMNEACGRNGSFTYGSNDNSEGTARTVSVVAGQSDGGNRQYEAQDHASNRGVQVIAVADNGGVTSYINASQGGGESNTVQTVDMGAAGNVGAQSYAGTYNSVATMVRAGGGNVPAQTMGMGGVQQVTVSEMAAQSSTLQAAQMGYVVNQQGFGNTSANTVGATMSTVQVQATAATAAAGGNTGDVQVQYTPLTVSSAAGAAAGVSTYNAGSATVNGQTQVQLMRTGGAEGASAPVNVPMENGMLEMIKDTARAKIIMEAIDKLNGDEDKQ